MMDITLAQILNHLYDVERENEILKEFIQKNAGVLKGANAIVPGLVEETAQPAE